MDRSSLWATQPVAREPFDFQRVIVFMHVYALNHAVDVVKAEVDAMYNSGLYERADRIHVYVAWAEGSYSTRDDVLRFFKDQGAKFMLSQITSESARYERITLEAMPEVVRDTDAVLYMHSKGVSHAADDGRGDMAAWTDAMLFHLVGHWRLCLDELRGFDALGINFLHKPQPHFSGNFWWATGAHIRRLPVPIALDYYATEMWVCQHARIKRLNWNVDERGNPSYEAVVRWPSRREYADRTDYHYEARTIW